MKIFGYRSKKAWKMALSTFVYGLTLIVIIIAAIDPSSESKVEYSVLKELKDECNIVVSAGTDDMDSLAKQLQTDYTDKCDSLFVMVGDGVDDSKVIGHKENIKIALTEKGKAQTGLDKIGYQIGW